MLKRLIGRRPVFAALATAVAVATTEMKQAAAHSACHCSRGCYYYTCKVADCIFGGYRQCQWRNDGRYANGCIKWTRIGCGYSQTGGLCDKIYGCTADLKPPSSCNITC